MANKAELVDKIAKQAKITKTQADAAFDAVIEGISQSLRKGQKTILVGFGSFSVNRRKARKGRNPQTGRVIQIKAKKVVRFKSGKELSKSVNR